jgi:hypothetical protein
MTYIFAISIPRQIIIFIDFIKGCLFCFILWIYKEYLVIKYLQNGNDYNELTPFKTPVQMSSFRRKTLDIRKPE